MYTVRFIKKTTFAECMNAKENVAAYLVLIMQFVISTDFYILMEETFGLLPKQLQCIKKTKHQENMPVYLIPP